jgi:hypothetical protein
VGSVVPLLTNPRFHIAYLQMHPDSKMILTNGANACDVFWRVGSAATFHMRSKVVGTVMAYSAITLLTGAQVEGRLFAMNAAITLGTNEIIFPCQG